jgi:hypothetical protein
MAKNERAAPRKPDYQISALLKGTKITSNIGAAWINEDGSLFIKFEHFVDLNQCRDPDVLVTAFDRRKPTVRK